MQLTVWTYEGPPHVGAMRIATAMKGVHYVLHAPQGDTYADLLFTMIERRDKRPPVTYTTFQARDLGTRHRRAVQGCRARRLERFKPQAHAGRRVLHRRADPGRSRRAGRRRWACRSRSCRSNCPPTSARRTGARRRPSTGWSARSPTAARRTARDARGRRPPAIMLGPTALGFRHRDDIIEVTELLEPARRRRQRGRAAGRLARRPARLGEADFNVVLYPEIADQAAAGSSATSASRCHEPIPIGVGATRDFIAEVADARRHRCQREPVARQRVAAALVFALGRFDLPDRQARVHLRRRDPRGRRRADRARGARLQGRAASAPTAANSPATCARRRRNTASSR